MDDIKFLLAVIIMFQFIEWARTSRMFERRVLRPWDKIRLWIRNLVKGKK